MFFIFWKISTSFTTILTPFISFFFEKISISFTSWWIFRYFYIYKTKKLWKKLIKKEFYKILDVNFIKIYIFHKISLLLKIIWIFKRLLSSITCNYLVHFATSAPKSFPGRPALKKFLLFSKKSISNFQEMELLIFSLKKSFS